MLSAAFEHCSQAQAKMPFEPRPIAKKLRGVDSLRTTSSTRQRGSASAIDLEKFRSWPCGDSLDRRLLKISLPVIANFAIAPLVGAIDLFWVNQMKDPLAVAGQSAANQLFNSVFFLTSFLPSVTATLIAKEHARDNAAGVQDAVGHALFVGFVLAILSTILLLWNPDKVRSVQPVP
jgi:Na+-driven multidrug efflux pump